jgi:hypothetical protein
MLPHLEAAVSTLKGDGLCALLGWDDENAREARGSNLRVLVLCAVHLGDDHAVNLCV